MTYPQAREAFENVAVIDPQCAMAHWGIAMTLFQPTWPTRPSPADLQCGWQAVQKAEAIGSPTERERLFVETAEAFFQEPTSSDYWQRIHRWEAAMEAVYSAFPEDPDATAFYALAHLATQPADSVALAHSERAAELLLTVQRDPDHPGAMHYMIHANDAPGRERESLEVVRGYEMVAPHNPHALHMPTHIYTRLGEWDGVIRGNLKAAEAALRHPAGAHGELVSDEFPHAIEYLVYAYLQQGADAEAAAQLKRLHDTEDLQPSFKTAFHLASTQARYALERHVWSEAALLVSRQAPGLDWDRFKWPEAVAWFARGLGAVKQGSVDESKRAVERLDQLERTATESGEDLFARNIRILGFELRAWIAHGDGNVDAGVELMRQAAELEASTPKHAVTPGPTLPAFEQLGDLFLAQGRAEEALAAYRRSLALYPGRLNTLLGAVRAARAGEDTATAEGYYQALLDVAAAGARPGVLREARGFASGSRSTQVSESAGADDDQYNRVLKRSSLHEGGTEVLIREALFPPGWTAPRHYHNADLFIYVIEGEFEVTMEGPGRVVYTSGQALRMQPRTTMDARNVSDTQPLKLAVFQVGAPDAPFVVPVE